MVKHYRPAGKKKEGNAARYFTRSQAVKLLQVSLPTFRKLCILKGIFPRDPKKRVKGNHHTYYHVKDIAYLHHEPVLEKLRERRAYQKKINKAVAKKNTEKANALKDRQPTYNLDKILRARYPKFVDALRDLDDCLSMVHLFAALPAIEAAKIGVKEIHKCQRLSHEWQAYIARTHKLRKVFVAVKGMYYQAEIEGQKITWLTPHALQQVMTEDVDFKIMLTFLELYEHLLRFVNFKLYQSINVTYPPALDPRLEALAEELYALSRYLDAKSRASMMESHAADSSISDQAEVMGSDESDLRLAQFQQKLPSNEPGALMHLVEDDAGENEDDEDTRECRKLFKNKKFFLSREVPRESLLFVIPAFGGTVSWESEGAPFKEADQSITYQIVDRPTQGHVYLSREYVQPQWVYDCVNARIILPTEAYMVGRIPPPHLSPFVDNEAEGYVPDYAESIKRLQAAARKEILPLPGVGNDDLEDPQNLLVEEYAIRAEAIEAAEKKQKLMTHKHQYEQELKMELQGGQYLSSGYDMNKESSSKDLEASESHSDLQQISNDIDNMAMVTMSRKKRRLYEAMKMGNEKRKGHVDHIKDRKKRILAAQKSDTK